MKKKYQPIMQKYKRERERPLRTIVCQWICQLRNGQLSGNSPPKLKQEEIIWTNWSLEVK